MARPEKVAAVEDIADPLPRLVRLGGHRVPRPVNGPAHDAAPDARRHRHVPRRQEHAGQAGGARTPASRASTSCWSAPPPSPSSPERSSTPPRRCATSPRTNQALVIKGGFMDGRPLTVAEVNQLADLESREVLLAKLAGAMKANLSKAAALFAAPASQVARMTQALADKRAEEEGGAAPGRRRPGGHRQRRHHRGSGHRRELTPCRSSSQRNRHHGEAVHRRAARGLQGPHPDRAVGVREEVRGDLRRHRGRPGRRGRRAGRRCRRRGPRGEGRVQRRPRGRRRQEDPGHQGRSRAGLGPGPQGGQGPGRVRPEAHSRGCGQGRGRRRARPSWRTPGPRSA